MSYEDIGAITDPLEAIRALFGEMNDMKSEIPSFKSECARLNHNISRLVLYSSKDL